MMKFVVLCALVGFAAAATFRQPSHTFKSSGSSDDVHAETTLLKSDVNEHGFQYAFATSNHIDASAKGDEAGNIAGDFGWVDPNGEYIHLVYTADENGYHPSGDVLPTPPPIPAAILKSLEYIRTHPPHEDNVSGHSSNKFAKQSRTFGHGRNF